MLCEFKEQVYVNSECRTVVYTGVLWYDTLSERKPSKNDGEFFKTNNYVHNVSKR